MYLSDDARAVFDAMREGITIIDTEGRIVFGNRAYREFLNKEAGGDIGPIEGCKLRELRPGARLPGVLEVGQPILHITRQEIQDFYFVNMYPIYEDGELKGGVSVVTFLEDAYQAKEELEAAEARSKQVLRRLNRANGARYTFDDIVAVSPEAMQVKELAQRIAATDATVLLESESGTGKELYAQAIHNAGARSAGVFVAINCANFNANMLESELFGYDEGAFTGARASGKSGFFELANGGTLFLDEVGELSLSLQSKLLRVLEGGEITRVGGERIIQVDTRIICATNRDLRQMVQRKEFREDLFFRLEVIPLIIPPLRDRREDIIPLAELFLQECNRKNGFTKVFSPATFASFQNYRWPGNVRELRNIVERLAITTNDDIIVHSLEADADRYHSGPMQRSSPGLREPLKPLKEVMQAVERNYIAQALTQTGWNVRETAAWHPSIWALSQDRCLPPSKQWSDYK